MQSPSIAEAPLPKVLLPNKKKVRKKKPTASVQSGLPSTPQQPDSDDDVEEAVIPDATLATRAPTPVHADLSGKDEAADTTLAARSAPTQIGLPSTPQQPDSDDDVEEAVIPDTTLATRSPTPVRADTARAHPTLYQVKDWLNGKPVSLMYDLCQLGTNLEQRRISVRDNDTRTPDARARDILSLLHTFHENKFVRYAVVQSLYAELGGVIVNKKGSHETWVFNEGVNKVRTTFFKLHDKDQYGPWTKSDVAQVILDVLKPFLIHP